MVFLSNSQGVVWERNLPCELNSPEDYTDQDIMKNSPLNNVVLYALR